MHRKAYRKEILKVTMPPVLAIALFAVAVFRVAMPTFERHLIEQKKEAIASVPQTALNVLRFYDQKAVSGEITAEQAKEQAIEQVRGMRYGKEDKDYFWINDLHPNMVMHPYRNDLDGKDISDFYDPDGKRLFREFVAVAMKDGSGYVPYLWQWQDDPGNIVPKLSYVELFRPWGWIIGTGIYLNDVQAEIREVLRTLTYSLIAILAITAVLSFDIVRRGIKEIKLRRTAEEELERHHALLEDLVTQRTAELQLALSEVKTLSGLLPICASCKRIRDDRGCWNQIESYIQDRSDAEFTHGICPECMRHLYPEYDDKN